MDEEPIRVGMTPPHPGSFIRMEILDELGLSVARAAEILGVRRATLSNLLNEKARLSPEMAFRIEKAFGVSMDTLLRIHDGRERPDAPRRPHRRLGRGLLAHRPARLVGAGPN